MKKLIPLILVSALPAAHAEVTAVGIDPVYSSITRTECAAPASGGWVGPALGAILGGGAGSQVGKGSGQAAAAAVGATLGAQAGAAMSNSNGSAQECRQVVDRSLTGYSIRTNSGERVFVPSWLMQTVQR